MKIRPIPSACVLVALVLWAACDAVEPGEEPLLVVEGYVEAGQMLPVLRLRQSRPLDAPYPDDASTAVTDAAVTLQIDDQPVVYRPVAGQPGHYEPTVERAAPARATVALEAVWGNQRVTAESTVPPAIRIRDLLLDVPEKPVAGIILDSLFIDPSRADSLLLDSLRTAERGFVYLVEVTLTWAIDFSETGPDSLYWVQTQLKPLLPGTLDDFFFKPEQILRERHTPLATPGLHTWKGVYAVPVVTEDDPLPPHDLRVGLVRSGSDYARFASSRDEPERREPVSNVTGGIGILAGISLDTLRVPVSPP